MVSVRWTGAAGLEFTYEKKTWLIDPYLSRVGKASVFFGRPQADREKISRYLETLPGKLQAVIVGHTHFDHALDVPEILGRFPVPLVGSESLEALMLLHGMPGKVTICSERMRLRPTRWGVRDDDSVPSRLGVFRPHTLCRRDQNGAKATFEGFTLSTRPCVHPPAGSRWEVVPARRIGQLDRRGDRGANLRCPVSLPSGMEDDLELPRSHSFTGQAEDRCPLPFR